MLKKTDRTKMQYCDALLDLSEEKKLSKITVRDLAEATGTTRQTFYNNFRDINDLISYLPINFLRATNMDTLSTANARRAYEYAYEHRGFFAQLPIHAGQNNFRDTFIAWLEEAYYANLIDEDMDECEQLYRKLRIDLFVIGITNQFLNWCSTGFVWPLDVLMKAQDEALPEFARATLPEHDAE